jgi:DNA polymerase-3 subunit delta
MNFQPEKALKHRVIMLAGDEEALRQSALQQLLDAANIEKDDFDLQSFSADESNPVTWIAEAGTSPFLGDRRTVIVRHLLRCNVEELAGTDLSKLPESSLLILVADDEVGDENRQSRLKTARKNWMKAVTSGGGVAFSFDPDPKAIREELKRAVAKTGKTISEQGAIALVEMTGGRLSRALDELYKLELYIGEQSQIREADVREVVMPSREWNVYKMVDAVFIGQMPEALSQLRVLMGSQTKAEDAAFSRILPTVSRHLRLLWQARACIEANCTSPAFAPDSVSRLFPDKNSIAKEQPYRISSMLNMAGRLKFSQIQRCFAIVADTDARLKGSLSSFSGLDALERMLLEMSAVVGPLPQRP